MNFDLHNLFILFCQIVDSFSKLQTNAKFSSKTAYPSNPQLPVALPERYTIVYTRYIGRHGSRYPSKRDVTEFKKIVNKIQSASPNFANYFNLSRIPLDETQDKQLLSLGKKELESIGSRYRKSRASLFSSTQFHPHNLKFNSTCLQRSFDSMVSFLSGMFGQTRNLSFVKNQCGNDTMLRFFNLCKCYRSFQTKYNEGKLQTDKFYNSVPMLSISKKFSKLLGMGSGEPIVPDDVRVLALLCANQILIYGSGLDEDVCRLFDENSFTVAEYLLDIRQFYDHGNSRSLNIQMSCPLFNDIYDSILQSFEKCYNNDTNLADITGHFSFSHAETLIPIIAKFGLLGGNQDCVQRNSSLRVNAENFQKLRNSRPFTGRTFSPMGGNIWFEVVCDEENRGQSYLHFMLNEKNAEIPCCKSRLPGHENFLVCSAEEFRNCFFRSRQNCEVDSCNMEIPCGEQV